MCPKLNSILRLLLRNGKHPKEYPSRTKFLGPCTKKTFFLGMATSKTTQEARSLMLHECIHNTESNGKFCSIKLNTVLDLFILHLFVIAPLGPWSASDGAHGA